MICDPISPRGIALFKQRPELKVTVLEKRLTEAELIPLIADVEAMVVRSETKITRKVIENAPKLRVVGRAGVGVDNVDVEAATERGIVVMNTPGGNTISTAELTFSMLMALARHIPQAHGSMKAGEWNRKSFSGTELYNKTLGILGMGRIGAEVAKRAQAFGMSVVAYDPYLSVSRAQALNVETLSLDAIYARSDFITVHMPMTDETKGMINSAAIQKMKRGVRLLNCARGGIIAESDLIEGIRNGQVAGAALDVYEVEPLAKDHPLRALPQVIMTPHLGASTDEAQENVGIEVAEAITDYLLMGGVRNAVNLPSLDAKTYAQVKPYLQLGEKLGLFLAQLAPKQNDRIFITYGGKAQELAVTDPVTRAILKGFLSLSAGKDLNYVNVRAQAAARGLTVEEKRSDEPVTFNEWLHVSVFSGDQKVSAGGTFFGSPNNPRIVRVFSRPVEIHPEGVVLLLNNKDRPGIVGYLGTLFAKHQVNIASMSLSRDTAGGQALSVFQLDTLPPTSLLEDIRKDPDISNVRVVKL
ncbi:MAG: phosphoglycerate dehydrogenase [Verrucomicrobia bacterium]|nr:phosphoglycerate dehydrogenase [Verrucomicrobiota bacterium]MBI3871049.1 phosphoglycerate dehydrogenase [Verrucomicrobiota bacterium]